MRLKLTMRIEYAPSKAAWLMPLDEARLGAAIRADCDLFKLPHPPTENIGKPTNEGIELFWSTFDGSQLFKDVMRTFNVDQVAGKRVFSLKEKAYVENLKRDRCIVNLTLEESFELGRPSPLRPRLHSLAQPPKPLADDAKPSKQKTQTKRRARSPRPFLPARNDWHVPRRRPLTRYNGSPRSYFKNEEKDRSLSTGYPYDSHSRSRSRSPRSCSPKDRRKTSLEYRRRASRSRSPDHRRKESRSRSRSSNYSDVHRRGRFKTKYRCTLSPAPPSKSENGREPEYYGFDLPPPPSSGVLKPPSKSSLASVGIRESIVARLTRECAATRRDIADAATRGRLLEWQLALLSASSPLLSLAPAHLDLASSHAAVLALRARLANEHLQLQGAEKVLGDVVRECERPVVVPALLELLSGWAVEDERRGCDVA
ncbi:hypothetical protein B0H16DRAFT_1501953 [Mycena metata]|uniref:Uncharacterized protein n=1 Tax=Mycena metata TaxID=1033252 RepID=A0AAD7K6B9_9AGAR|nr:hypothetical protein B0H16DRAFT_1501953 [Mycena metata]